MAHQWWIPVEFVVVQEAVRSRALVEVCVTSVASAAALTFALAAMAFLIQAGLSMRAVYAAEPVPSIGAQFAMAMTPASAAMELPILVRRLTDVAPVVGMMLASIVQE